MHRHTACSARQGFARSSCTGNGPGAGRRTLEQGDGTRMSGKNRAGIDRAIVETRRQQLL